MQEKLGGWLRRGLRSTSRLRMNLERNTRRGTVGDLQGPKEETEK